MTLKISQEKPSQESLPSTWNKMAKRKSSFLFRFFSFIFKIFKYIFIGIYYVLRFIFTIIKITFLGIKNIFSKIKISRERPESIAQYEELIELKKISGDISNLKKIILGEGKIGIILGARGSGKSALGIRILENVKAKTSKKIYAMGFNINKVPSWIEIITDIENIQNNSFVLIDESGINFSSRSSMSSPNKLLSQLLFISRHKNISILFIAQNSSNVEINTLRQADYLLLKNSSLLQLDFERKKIISIYKEVESDFKKFRGKDVTYIYSDVFKGFVQNKIPSFWSEGLSKSFSGE
ncbi:hypothetical protein HYW76_01280 [Candidatus Pacearchaeota archaeon]|nr:hypothetical protein [Candidatus Pacearchaeota archaeon]